MLRVDAHDTDHGIEQQFVTAVQLLREIDRHAGDRGDELLFDGTVRVVAIDMAKNRPVSLPPALRQRLSPSIPSSSVPTP